MKKRTKMWCSSPVTRSLSRKAAVIGSFASLLLLPEISAGAGTTLRQTIMAELRYDTNASIAAEGEQTGDDFTLLLAPDFQAINQRNKLALTANYRPTGYFYFQNPDLNTISHSGFLAADYNFSAQTSISAEERLIYSRESLETTLIGLQNQRSAIWTNTIILSVNHRLTHKTGITLSASDNILKFDNPVSVDSRNDSGSIGLNYQATPETQLNGSYNFSHVNYDLPGGASSSQSTHSLNAGFNTRFRETATLLLSAGAVYADAAGMGDGFFDWLAAAEVRKAWPKYSANLNYTRRTTSSSGVTDQLTLNDSISAGLNHEINRNLDISIFGSYTHNYTKPITILDTTAYSTGASGIWQMREWLSLGLGFSHFKQESDGLLGGDIERDHIFVNVNMTTYEGRL